MKRPRVLWSAVAGAVLAAAVAAIYLGIIAAEGEGELGSGRVLLVAGAFAAAALALGIAAWPVRFRLPLLVGAALLLMALTVLGAASIGVVLLPAAVLAWVAAARVARRR